MDPSPFITGSAPYLTAFLAGLFGGVHCVGMCGGIVGGLVMGLPGGTRSRVSRLLPFLLAYNSGRIATYTLLGVLVGWLGWLAGDLLAAYRSWFYLRLFAATVMIALGLYLAGWWTGARGIERLGGRLWQGIAPLTRRLYPLTHPGQALLLGLLWGLLPCGLVYYTLSWAFAAGGALQGGAFMLAFGLGTLPTLLGAGFASGFLSRGLQRPGVRRLAGLVVIALGIWTLAATLLHQSNIGLGCLPPG